MSKSTYNKERYEYYKFHKICVDCGMNEVAKGRTRCLECLSKSVERTLEWQKKNTKKNREYQKEYQKNLRAYRKKNGLCQQCGKPTHNGYTFCTEHLAVRRIKAENRRREQGILPRWMFGNGELCTFCGNPVKNKGDKCCPICLERERKWSAEQRKKIDYKNHIWRKKNDALFFKVESQKGV